MKDNKKHLITFAIIGLVAIVIITYVLMDQATAPTIDKAVPTASPVSQGDIKYVEYDDKLVYSMKPNISLVQLEADCEERGGTFDECGSACPSDAEGCIEMCAYTCEFSDVQNTDEQIIVQNPQPDDVITSPLTISGEARGSWFFEGEFPVILTDWDGLIIAETQATADGEWMTEDFVSFSATLEFAAPEYGDNGSLILQKANPSGLPENDDAKEFMIRFR